MNKTDAAADGPAGARPQRRRRLSHAARSEGFVAKAAELFAEVGFSGGTRELARRLGVSQPLLYRYFPSKDDLIDAVYRRVYIDHWREEWDALLEDRSRPVRERLQLFYEAYTEAIFTRQWMRISLFSGLRGEPINRRYARLVEERILARIVREIRHEAGLPERGEVSRAELDLAWMLHGGIVYYGVRKHIYDLPVFEDRSRMIANALDVFLEGVAQAYGAGLRLRALRPRAARPGTAHAGSKPVRAAGRASAAR
jgi:AcrR family transcriptional regulator